MSRLVNDQRSLGAALTTASNLEAMAKIYQGMPLIACLPGSPADKAGLRLGDIVLAVNGVPTPDPSAFVHARGLREEGATVRLVRAGREFEVQLEW